MRKSEDWKEAHKYADVTPIFNGEIGELHGVRFVESTAAKIWKESADNSATYATLFMGKGAFGILDPEGEGMEMIIKTIDTEKLPGYKRLLTEEYWKISDDDFYRNCGTCRFECIYHANSCNWIYCSSSFNN